MVIQVLAKTFISDSVNGFHALQNILQLLRLVQVSAKKSPKMVYTLEKSLEHVAIELASMML